MTEEKKELEPPEFEVIPDAIADQMIRPARSAVSWGPVIEQLLDGKKLFVTDLNLTDGSLKYLRLALSSRQASKGGVRYKLHAQRGWLGAAQGRLLWADPKTDVPTVTAEVVGVIDLDITGKPVLAPPTLIHTQVGPRNAWTNEQGIRHYRWDGRDLPSVTSIRRLAGQPFGLHNWVINQVIDRAINGYADLGKIIGQGTPEATKAATIWLRNASTEKRDIAASKGTRIHDAAATGRALTDVSSDVAPGLRQYRHWLEESRAYVIANERQVWNLKVGYAGTFDLLVQLPDGSIWVVDIKTGKGTYPEHAIQGVAYAMAQFVGEDDVKDARLTRILRKANGVAILHLSDTGWTWSQVKLTPEIWKAFKGLLDFATFLEANPKIDPLVEGVIKGAA